MGGDFPDEGGGAPKTRAPRLRRDLLLRKALVATLLDGDTPVVAVEAPAGYGKTTLLRQWAAAETRPTAWLTLDRADDDPAVLGHHLAVALGRIGPTGPAPSSSAGVEALLAGVDGPLVLLVDDAHEVTAADALSTLNQLLDLVPAGAVVAVAGRRLPGLHLARRELAGEALHLGSPALAFDAAEATAALGPLAEPLGPAGVGRLLAMVDGWPAGVALASSVLDQEADPRAALATLATSRLVRAYVDQELLAAEDDASRDFLVRTAVLPRLTGGLCDAVLGVSGSADRLEAMAAAGDRFLTPLEGEVAWYRHHPLVAEALVAELRRRSPDAEPVLHRRAATWWRSVGGADEAVHHALAAGDHDLAAAVVGDALFECLDRGRLATLGRWVAAFPDGSRARQPELALVAGWLALLAGRRDELAGWLDRLAQDAPQLAVPRAALAMVAGLDGVKQTIRDAETVLAAGREGNTWWPSAVQIRAVGRVAAGLVDGDERIAELTTAVLAVGDDGLIAALLRANLALAHFARGRPADGHEHSRRAVAELEAVGDDADPLSAMVPAVDALSRGLQGDRAGATAAIDHVLGVIQGLITVMPRGAAQVALVLADTALLCDDAARADRALGIAVGTLPDLPDAPLLEQWLAAVETRRAALGDPPRGAEVLTPAERRVLLELPTHRSLQEIAERVYVSRNTVKSHTVAIYRKLGVSGRSAAVARATELGLLGDSPDREDDGRRR